MKNTHNIGIIWIYNVNKFYDKSEINVRITLNNYNSKYKIAEMRNENEIKRFMYVYKL